MGKEREKKTRVRGTKMVWKAAASAIFHKPGYKSTTESNELAWQSPRQRHRGPLRYQEKVGTGEKNGTRSSKLVEKLTECPVIKYYD